VAERPQYDEETGARIIWRDNERSHYTEKKIAGGELLATWERRPLPADANVVQVRLIPYRGERGVLVWHDGRLWLPEGEPKEGESLDDAIERIALEQAGIAELTAGHLGHVRVQATRLSKTYAPDTVVYEALYSVDVGGLADAPSDERYERRMVHQREVNELLRLRYSEWWREYRDALDPFLLERVKASRNLTP
jgi:hypothetical protein